MRDGITIDDAYLEKNGFADRGPVWRAVVGQLTKSSEDA